MHQVNPFNFSIKSIYRGVTIFFTLNLFFLLSTAFVHAVYAEEVDKHQILRNDIVALIIDELNLGNENNLAAWYSSMLLLTTGLLALICFWIDRNKRQTNKIFSLGWLVLTALFTLLSFDEMGSLHENAGKLAMLDVMGDKSWESVIMLPGIIILLFMAIFAWLSLRHNYDVIFFMVLGAVFYISVPFQEHFEIELYNEKHFDISWRRPAMHVVFEEGSELFGSLSFFMAFVCYIRANVKSLSNISFSLRCKSIIQVLIVIALFGASTYALIYYFNDIIVSPDGGTASNWLPSAFAFLLSISCLLYLKTEWIVFFFFLVVSAYFGTNYYKLIYWVDIAVLTGIIELLLIIGVTAFIMHFRKMIDSKEWQIILFGLSIALLSTFIFSNILITPIAFFVLVAFAISYFVYANKDISVLIEG